MSGNIHKRPKGAARILTAVVAGVLALSLAGCAVFDSWVGDVKGELTGNAFTMKAYSNTGELTMTAHGRKVGMEGNETTDDNGDKVMSSVVTVTIDGKEVESCGDPLVFNEDDLEPEKDFAADQLKSYDDGRLSNNTLFAQPLNRFKNLFGKARVVVVKSQMGSPIEAFGGNDVYWKVCDDLPKTTKLMIDGKALYIHRANFQIIDKDLL